MALQNSKEKLQKKKILLLSLIMVICVFGISYAWLSLTLTSTKTNLLRAGTLALTLDESLSEGINLQASIPMTDTTGKKGTPYRFTLKNTGNIDSNYAIYLEDGALESGESRIEDRFLKYQIKTLGLDNVALLSSIKTDKGHLLDSGIIKKGATKEYELRLWIDQEASNEIINQVFRGKIKIEATQKIEMVPTDSSCFTFDETTGTITAYSDSCPKDVVIPRTINGKEVKVLGEMSFQSKELTSMILPEGLQKVDFHAASHNHLKSIDIPNTVENVASFAFYSNQISQLTLSTNLKALGTGAFNNNHLPDDNAFFYKYRNDGTLDQTVLVSYGGKRRSGIIIPSSVTTIEHYAFHGGRVESITIPNTVTSIGISAFGYNSLTTITIPASVQIIMNEAFYNPTSSSQHQLIEVVVEGKNSTSDFTSYPETSPFTWADGYSDANIIFKP